MIGIYGGSFDPIHLGHLETATAIKQELNLERCLLMPCANPVHKKELFFVASKRLEMLNLAVKEYSELEIDNREIIRAGSSYTIDTLRELREENPNETFCLIIGMDSFIQFKNWRKWQEFYKFAHLITLQRANYQSNNLSLNSFATIKDKKLLTKKQNGMLYFASSPVINISSSEIRYKIVANKNLSDFLPETIINYIKNNDAI